MIVHLSSALKRSWPFGCCVSFTLHFPWVLRSAAYTDAQNTHSRCNTPVAQCVTVVIDTHHRSRKTNAVQGDLS
uniref:Uncharacterized protein n=1 Tax=Anguilla anguilla TaxID=7936 RepID=A0A0E9V738_ANGAN